jgi:hypothetical protein
VDIKTKKYLKDRQYYIHVPEEHRTELVQEVEHRTELVQEVGHTPRLALEFHMVLVLHIRHLV